METCLKALSIWDFILFDIDMAPLRVNSTLYQIWKHEKEKTKKPKALSCIQLVVLEIFVSKNHIL